MIDSYLQRECITVLVPRVEVEFCSCHIRLNFAGILQFLSAAIGDNVLKCAKYEFFFKLYSLFDCEKGTQISLGKRLILSALFFRRGERIRTFDPLLPKQVR